MSEMHGARTIERIAAIHLYSGWESASKRFYMGFYPREKTPYKWLFVAANRFLASDCRVLTLGKHRHPTKLVSENACKEKPGTDVHVSTPPVTDTKRMIEERTDICHTTGVYLACGTTLPNLPDVGDDGVYDPDT